MYGSNELTNPLLLFSQMTLGPTLNIFLSAPSNHVGNQSTTNKQNEEQDQIYKIQVRPYLLFIYFFC